MVTIRIEEIHEEYDEEKKEPTGYVLEYSIPQYSNTYRTEVIPAHEYSRETAKKKIISSASALVEEGPITVQFANGSGGEKPDNAVSEGTASGTSSATHDPTEYETTVSDSWWYGVAGGTGLWALMLALTGSIGASLGAFAGFLIMVAWVGLPLAAYFDMQYIRANAEWNPNTILWVVLLAVWFINVFAGLVYLYRRHEVLGEP
jgi:hypothetical protein